MDLSNAAKWTLFNRLITAGAMLLGTALAVFGFVLGFWGSIETLLIDGNVQTAVENANPILTLALAALGFLVWQIGKTYALFWSLPRASGRAAAKRFDHGRLKSEVVEALDERLAEMEEDVAETRRSVQELKRSEHAAAFDESDVLESEIDQRTESVGTPQARSSASRSSEQSDPSDDTETTQTNTQPDEQPTTTTQQTTPTDDRHPRDERTDQSAERTPDREPQPTGTHPQPTGSREQTSKTQEQTTGTQEQTDNTNTQPQTSETGSDSNTPEPTQTETQVADRSASEEPTGPTGRSQPASTEQSQTDRHATSTEQSQTDRHTTQTDRRTRAQSQDRSVEERTGQPAADEPAESGFEFSNPEDSAPEQADDRPTTPPQSNQPTADDERSSSEPEPEDIDRSETTDTDEDASSSDSEDPLA